MSKMPRQIHRFQYVHASFSACQQPLKTIQFSTRKRIKKSIRLLFDFLFYILTKESQQPYLEQIFLLPNIGTKWKIEIDFHVQYFKPIPMGQVFFSSFLFGVVFFFLNANVRCYVTLIIFFLLDRKSILIEHASCERLLGPCDW